MIPTNDLHAFARYKVVRTFRPDGAVLTATRVVKDIELPVYWDVEVTHPQQSSFRALEMSIIEPPSTSKLIKRAAEEGFGDWYPPIEKMVDVFPLDAEVGDQSKAQRIPKYVEPDTTEYLVD